jgi:hypothetical protein
MIVDVRIERLIPSAARLNDDFDVFAVSGFADLLA